MSQLLDDLGEVENAVDVALETKEGDYYQFLSVSKEVLDGAIEKALKDNTTFSLVSLRGAALVVPWQQLKRVLYVSVFSEDREDSWIEAWEYPTTPSMERATG